MLDREPPSEVRRFFEIKRGLSNHLACLPRGRAARFETRFDARELRSRAVVRPPDRDCSALLPGFVDFSLTARTKRRVMASISRFSLGLP